MDNKTPPPGDAGATSAAYIQGVILALCGSTLEALGLLLWKVHFNRCSIPHFRGSMKCFAFSCMAFYFLHRYHRQACTVRMSL